MMIIRWQHCIFNTTRLMLFSNPIAMFFIHFLSKQLGLSIMINIRVIYSFLSLNIPGSMTISGRRFAGVLQTSISLLIQWYRLCSTMWRMVWTIFMRIFIITSTLLNTMLPVSQLGISPLESFYPVYVFRYSLCLSMLFKFIFPPFIYSTMNWYDSPFSNTT